MDYSSMTNQELEQLIEQKDMEAACEMAERCLNGTQGVERNLNRAYQLFHRGEGAGSTRAYQGLAFMYEHGILFAQNIPLAKEYYAKAGIEKTVFAEEKPSTPHYVSMDASENVPIASTLAATEAAPTMEAAVPPMAAAPTMGTAVPPMAAVDPPVEAPVPPMAAAPAAAPVNYGAEAATVNLQMAEMAARKAQEAAEAARMSSVKAQEAAAAADMAAEYARKACM